MPGRVLYVLEEGSRASLRYRVRRQVEGLAIRRSDVTWASRGTSGSTTPGASNISVLLEGDRPGGPRRDHGLTERAARGASSTTSGPSMNKGRQARAATVAIHADAPTCRLQPVRLPVWLRGTHRPGPALAGDAVPWMRATPASSQRCRE